MNDFEQDLLNGAEQMLAHQRAKETKSAEAGVKEHHFIGEHRYSVFWSNEDTAYVIECRKFPSPSYAANKAQERLTRHCKACR